MDAASGVAGTEAPAQPVSPAYMVGVSRTTADWVVVALVLGLAAVVVAAGVVALVIARSPWALTPFLVAVVIALSPVVANRLWVHYEVWPDELYVERRLLWSIHVRAGEAVAVKLVPGARGTRPRVWVERAHGRPLVLLPPDPARFTLAVENMQAGLAIRPEAVGDARPGYLGGVRDVPRRHLWHGIHLALPLAALAGFGLYLRFTGSPWLPLMLVPSLAISAVGSWLSGIGVRYRVDAYGLTVTGRFRRPQHFSAADISAVRRRSTRSRRSLLATRIPRAGSHGGVRIDAGPYGPAIFVDPADPDAFVVALQRVVAASWSARGRADLPGAEPSLRPDA